MAASPTPPSPASIDPAVRPPEMTILSDHPILRDRADEKTGALREGDAFELFTRLGAVYDIVRHTNTRAPLAIGVFGDWGTGKSSAMRWLSDQLTTWSAPGVEREGHCRCRCVWFEPWKYQTRDDVWRGLIAEVIIDSMNASGASVATVVSAVKKFGAFLGRSFIHTASSIKLKPRAEVNAGIGKLGGEAEINLDSLTKIAEDYKQTVHPEKAYLNEFESTLKSWVADSLGPDERMVLFIDDLDRCLPAVVLEVLEALKLYLNIPQLVFVIGLDREVVKAVIRRQYKDAGLAEAKADSYLDKMFQVEVEVPPSEGQMDGYFDAQVKHLDAATNHYWSRQLRAGGESWQGVIEQTIKSIALHNPREVKRLLNSTLMGGTSAHRRGETDADAKKRFGQGCQAYLIARLLRDNDLCPASMLRYKETWAFLAAWSRFVRDYPLYRPGMEAETGTEAMEKITRGPRHGSPAENEAQNRALQAVRALVPRTRDRKREPYPLMDVDLLWELLAIEVSADVGQSMAVKEVAPVAPAITVDVQATVDINAPTGRSHHERVEGGARVRAQDARPEKKAESAVTLSRLPRVVRSRIARALQKDASALTPADAAGVTELDLSDSDIDDEGLARLTREGTVLRALTSLDLAGTEVTDEGVKALASPETSLKDLTSLLLWGTGVTDEGVKALASPKSSLKRLSTLNLGSTQVTDFGVKTLSSPQTALLALTKLEMYGTKVTDNGVKALASQQTGLKAITLLDLRHTRVTDEGIKALASPRTGLTGLTALYLFSTDVTDGGIIALASPETGLKGLTSLDLRFTKVTDEGIKALASPNTGLRGLTSLDLGATAVTMKGVNALKARWPGIEIDR